MGEAILLGVFKLMLTLRAWGRRWQRQELERRRADHERYSNWVCPSCGFLFGPHVWFIGYGKTSEPPEDPDAFDPEVIIVCRNCRRMNCYDHDGNPEWEQCEPYPHELPEPEDD